MIGAQAECSARLRLFAAGIRGVSGEENLHCPGNPARIILGAGRDAKTALQIAYPLDHRDKLLGR